jgi:hypothetical protein
LAAADEKTVKRVIIARLSYGDYRIGLFWGDILYSPVDDRLVYADRNAKIIRETTAPLRP